MVSYRKMVSGVEPKTIEQERAGGRTASTRLDHIDSAITLA